MGVEGIIASGFEPVPGVVRANGSAVRVGDGGKVPEVAEGADKKRNVRRRKRQMKRPEVIQTFRRDGTAISVRMRRRKRQINRATTNGVVRHGGIAVGIMRRRKRQFKRTERNGVIRRDGTAVGVGMRRRKRQVMHSGHGALHVVPNSVVMIRIRRRVHRGLVCVRLAVRARWAATG